MKTTREGIRPSERQEPHPCATKAQLQLVMAPASLQVALSPFLYLQFFFNKFTGLSWLQCCTLRLPLLPTMVVIVDLDDDAPSLHAPHASGGFLNNANPLHHSLASTTAKDEEQRVQGVEERPNPNINGFSAALSCYP